MKQRKNIDDLFRENISGFSAQPSEKVWENIETAYLAGRSSSRRWVIYSVAAALLLLVGYGGWYFISGENNVTDHSSEMAAVESTNEISVDNLNTVNDEQVLQGTESTPETTVIESDGYSGKDKTAVQLSAKDDVAVESPVSSPENQGDVKKSIVPSDEKTIFIPSAYYDIAFMNSVGLSFNSQPQPAMIDPEKVTGLQAFLDKKKKSHCYTGLSATAGMMYYPSTKDQFTWSADLAFGLTAGKFYFETGIGYQAINEQGIYLIEFRSQDSIGYYNEVKSFEVNPSNPDEIFYKTEEVTVYDSIDHFTHVAPTYKYNFINVPVTIGYRVFERKKLSIGVETGLLFSFMVSKEIPEVGFGYDEYTHVRTINMTSERVEINYRWQLAVRLNYRFAGSMSVSVKPVFNKYLNSIYDTEKGYPNLKPYSMGLQVGLYYGF